MTDPSTSTAIDRAAPPTVAGIVQREYTRQQINLIRQTIMPGATDPELALFLEYARRTGLDPFAKQLIPIRTYDSKTRSERYEFMTGIDGLRLVAHRTGEHNGVDGPYYRAKGGEWKDYWDGDDPPWECKFTVFRKGAEHGFTARIKYAEFVRTRRRGEGRNAVREVYGPWATMPEQMMAIRAESHALRRAFPRETSGLFLREDDAGEAAAVHVVNPDAEASDAQKGELHRLAEVFGWTEDEYRARLEAATGKRSAKDLTKGQAHELIDTWRAWEQRLKEDGDAPPELGAEDIVEGELVEDESASDEEAGAAATAQRQGPGGTAEGEVTAPARTTGGRRARGSRKDGQDEEEHPDAGVPPHAFVGTDDERPCRSCGWAAEHPVHRARPVPDEAEQGTLA